METNLILVNVLVRDRDGEMVRGLTPADFEIFDNGVKRSIAAFSAESSPVTYGVVFDMHPTSTERVNELIDSLKRFAAELGESDDFFLVTFNMGGLQPFDFVPTFEQLEKHMSDPDQRVPNSLYDAIQFASSIAQRRKNNRKVLIVVSDGADHGSRKSIRQLREELENVRAELYAVVYDEPGNLTYSDITHGELRPSSDATPLDRAAIQDLSLKTGGATYSGSFRGPYRLLRVFKQIETEIRGHYTLGFYTEALVEGAYTLRVAMKGERDRRGLTLTYVPKYRIKGRTR